MTTSTVDWSHLESSASISLPADVSNSDLFGGDLFGDELIDMYGSSAVSEETTNQGILSNEGDKTLDDNKCLKAVEDVVESESKTDVTTLDGFGAFRPCTSFNDFAELLPPSTAPVGAVAIGPVSPATVSLSDCSTSNDPSNQPILSYVAGSATTTAVKTNQMHMGKGIKTKLTLAGKNHAAVVPTSLLPTGTGVKVNQQAACQAAAAASQVSTPDPLGAAAEAAKQKMILQQNRMVSNASITAGLRTLPSATPDQVVSAHKNQMSALNEVSAPVLAASAVKPKDEVVNTAAVSNGISQATITAAAVAAAANAPTAADFTAVAQAAVSTLMMNAGTHSVTVAPQPQQLQQQQQLQSMPTSEAEDELVLCHTNGVLPDVSTAHVTALTSSNWVSAVNNNTPNIVHSAPTLMRNIMTTSSSGHSLDQQHADALIPAAKRRRQNLTPDERAKQNRDRNREHARNTRLRKKAYVEELKRTLTELVTQRDATDMEQRRVAQRELEQREVRFRVTEEFLKLRGDNQRSTARWSAILENDFSFSLPITNYRGMVLSQNNSNTTPDHQQTCAIPRQVSIDGVMECVDYRSEQLISGVEEAKVDADHLAAFLERTYFPENAGQPLNQNTTKNIAILYHCNRNKFFMDGTSAFLNWTATTHFLSDSNLPPLTCKGVVRASFSPASNKLLSAELTFDTGAITSQVSRIQSLMQVDQGAAAEADAILDSLEMPYFLPSVIGASSVNNSSSCIPVSITSSEKSESENEDDTHHVINDITL